MVSKVSCWPHSNLCRVVSVRFRYGLWVERFERFCFSVPAAPLRKRLCCVSVQFNRKGRFQFLEHGSVCSGSAFGSRKNSSDSSGFRFWFSSWAILPLSEELLVKQNSFWPLTVRGVSRSCVQGSKNHVLSAERKERKSFCLGEQWGRPVTRVTGKSFTC